MVLPNDTYGVVAKAASLLGTDARFAASDPDALLALADGAALVWIETPTNPSLAVIDIAAFAAEVHERGALLVVDGTLATPLAQQALTLGADVSVVSDSKAMTGHSDLGAGARRVPCRGARRVRCGRGATRRGRSPGRSRRGWRTARWRRWACGSSGSARTRSPSRVALESRGVDVLYPGLPSHPGHAVAAAQMGGLFGPVVSFVLTAPRRRSGFLARARWWPRRPPSAACTRAQNGAARWGIEPVPEGFIRLSCGVEDTDDLVADVLRALPALTSGPIMKKTLVVLCAFALLGGATGVVPAQDPTPPPVVKVTVLASKMEVSGADGLGAGPTRFEFSVPGRAERGFLVFELKDGVTRAEAEEETPKIREPQDAEKLGRFVAGSVVDGGDEYATTISLREGEYVLIDFTRQPVVRTGFTVGTAPNGATARRPTSTVDMRDYSFRGDAVLPRSGVIRVVNNGRRLHHALALRLKPGKTPRQAIRRIKSGKDRGRAVRG